MVGLKMRGARAGQSDAGARAHVARVWRRYLFTIFTKLDIVGAAGSIHREAIRLGKPRLRQPLDHHLRFPFWMLAVPPCLLLG